MKKIFIVLVAVLFIASSVYALDGSRIGSIKLNSRTIYSNATEEYGHTHVTTSPTSVYRISFRTATAGAGVQLFDSNTTGTQSSTNAHISNLAAPAKGGNRAVKADPGEATASDTHVITYDPPLQFDSGVLAGFWGEAAPTGAMTIEYRQD